MITLHKGINDLTADIQGGNQITFDMMSNSGRIHLEGTGTIVAKVSVDGENWKTIEHDESFSSGVCIAPLSNFNISDRVQISASTLTKVIVNFSAEERTRIQ